VTKDGVALGIADVQKPGSGQILVKVVAAAQNPVDWKFLKAEINAGNYGGIVGSDFAGVVEEIGQDVPDGVRTVGERVAGFVKGVFHPNGSFSEYLVANAQLGVVRVPATWSFEESAQLGVGPFTALQCLHETLELPSPFEARSGPQRDILIWGGASSVGQYAIQFAKLNGLRVTTTASPKNFDLVKGLGADKVFDYKDENVVEKVHATTGNALEIAIDTISEGKTPEQVTAAIGDKGGKVAIIRFYESPRPDVTVTFSRVYDLLEPESKGQCYVDLLERILATGQVKTNLVLIRPNGIAGVKDGLQHMQDGKVSGEKITYRILDTPEV